MKENKRGVSIPEAVFSLMLVSVMAMFAIAAVHKISSSSLLITARQSAWSVLDNSVERLDNGTPINLGDAERVLLVEFMRYAPQFRDSVSAVVRHSESGILLEIKDDGLVYAHVVVPYE